MMGTKSQATATAIQPQKTQENAKEYGLAVVFAEDAKGRQRAELVLGGPRSPRDLPGRIARALGEDMVGEIARGLERPGWKLDQHWGAGMLVRNAIRRHSVGWTEEELDGGWDRVARAAQLSTQHGGIETWLTNGVVLRRTVETQERERLRSLKKRGKGRRGRWRR